MKAPGLHSSSNHGQICWRSKGQDLFNSRAFPSSPGSSWHIRSGSSRALVSAQQSCTASNICPNNSSAAFCLSQLPFVSLSLRAEIQTGKASSYAARWLTVGLKDTTCFRLAAGQSTCRSRRGIRQQHGVRPPSGAPA